MSEATMYTLSADAAAPPDDVAIREALDTDARRRARLLRAWRKVRAERARLRTENGLLRNALQRAAEHVVLARQMED